VRLGCMASRYVVCTCGQVCQWVSPSQYRRWAALAGPDMKYCSCQVQVPVPGLFSLLQINDGSS
jgi:hypothetical protein